MTGSRNTYWAVVDRNTGAVFVDTILGNDVAAMMRWLDRHAHVSARLFVSDREVERLFNDAARNRVSLARVKIEVIH